MKPLSERDENFFFPSTAAGHTVQVGMKPLSERDENCLLSMLETYLQLVTVGMKPLSERDENNLESE